MNRWKPIMAMAVERITYHAYVVLVHVGVKPYYCTVTVRRGAKRASDPRQLRERFYNRAGREIHLARSKYNQEVMDAAIAAVEV